MHCLYVYVMHTVNSPYDMQSLYAGYLYEIHLFIEIPFIQCYSYMFGPYLMYFPYNSILFGPVARANWSGGHSKPHPKIIGSTWNNRFIYVMQ